MQKLKTEICESHEAINDFINKQKTANRNKKIIDTDTLFTLGYMEANGNGLEEYERDVQTKIFLSKHV